MLQKFLYLSGTLAGSKIYRNYDREWALLRANLRPMMAGSRKISIMARKFSERELPILRGACYVLTLSLV